MKPIKVYEYKNCSTCKKALQFLDERKISYEKIPIVDQPPSLAELRQMLKFLQASGGTLRNLFNTSGEKYRELGVAEQLKNGLSESEALKLLSENGKLIKRPFVLGASFGVVGFKAEDWLPLFAKK
jgi:arsenate reductase